MSQEAGQNVNETVRALRQEFDLSFAQAPQMKMEAPVNFLAIRLEHDAYAIRVAEIGGLYTDRRIMPLPTPIPELLGIAGFRGQIAPVYDLAALLGYVRQTPPRWLILMQAREPVALAFDVFEAHFAVLSERIVTAHGAAEGAVGTSRKYLFDAVRTDDAIRPIIHLQSLLDNIQRQAALSVRQRSDQS